MAVFLHRDDLPENLDLGASVAVDTESMGLNWDRDRLCLVQLSSGDGNAHLVHLTRSGVEAKRLKALMANPQVVKIFHFARADLAAIKCHLDVTVAPVYCTKVASVLVRTFTDRHSLKDLARDLAGVDLSKEQQTSDWGATALTQDQLNYAASDVLYLHKIKARLDEMLTREGRTELARRVMDFIPVRADLDVLGWREVDVFAHKPIRRPD